MHNSIIYKCSSFVYRHSYKVLTRRLVHTLSSAKHKRMKWRPLNITNSLSEPTTLPRFIPVRTLYYLENEVEKEYKRFPSPLEVSQETIKEVCLSENPSSPEDWDNIKMEIMNRCFILTDENFDSVLMQVLLDMQNLELAQSFMSYLQERKLKPNFVTLCKYMVLCSKNRSVVGQDVILETYEKILSAVSTSVLDCQVIKFLVLGLCATDKWRKSLDYLNQLHKNQLSSEMCNAVASAALRNRDYNLARDVLHEWYKPGTVPAEEVFEEYMNFIIDLHRRDPTGAGRCFAQLAEYLRSRNIILKRKAAVYVEDYFKRSHKYSTTYAKVDRDGVCSACKSKLEPCSLTDGEFLYLKESFLKYSLMKSDVFINTTDSEFGAYCRYVEKMKPFDIVLDGLNVAHAICSPNKRKDRAVQLFNVVNHLSQSWDRILVLGRFHMKRWPPTIMRAIQKKSFVFYVSNMSQDDPFLIYAALASGPNATLVSLDMMRDHISRLPDPKLIHLFKKWQQSHQVYLSPGENENDIVLMGPLKHNIAIQGSMRSGWHVPYDNGVKLEPYEELNNWLCIQKRI